MAQKFTKKISELVPFGVSDFLLPAHRQVTA